MSKLLSATCSNNVVTIEGVAIDAEILSQGTKQSSGLAVIEDQTVTYVTSNASDIADLIQSLTTIVDQIILITTGLDAVSTNPGSVTALVAQLTVLKTQFALTKDLLK